MGRDFIFILWGVEDNECFVGGSGEDSGGG